MSRSPLPSAAIAWLVHKCRDRMCIRVLAPIRHRSKIPPESGWRSPPSALPLKPAIALRVRGESNRPAMKASRKRQSSASFGGKSPPTMPLIPAMRPLKNISSTIENPIRAPPIAADRNGCMNNPPSAWLGYLGRTETAYSTWAQPVSPLYPRGKRTRFTPPTIAHLNEAAKSADLPAMQATKLNAGPPRCSALTCP
jgi:hypothetical protein